MFSLDVVDTDAFLDLPSSSQALYFHLGMRADDDGFVSSPKRITSTVGASPDDLRLLAAKGLIIPFESGVCVIRDWKINNYLRSDRYTETLYQNEKRQLESMTNAAGMTLGIPSDTPSVNTGKDSIGKDRIGKKAAKQRTARFAPPTIEEVEAYCRERGNSVDAQRFVDFYEANGWVQGRGKPLKDWKAAVRTWENREESQRKHADNWVSAESLKHYEKPVDLSKLVEYPPGSGNWCMPDEVPT